MSLIDMAGRIMRSLGVGGEKPQVSREQAFQARPVRNPELKWRVNDEECIEVVIPRRRDRMGRIMGWLFAVPESRPVALDEVGTHIWGLCDGEHTVGDLMDAIKSLGDFDESLVIAVSDHGGTDIFDDEGNVIACSHGTDHQECMEIFWAARGPGIVPGEIDAEFNIGATAPIVAHALGLDAPEGWEETVPAGLFEDK